MAYELPQNYSNKYNCRIMSNLQRLTNGSYGVQTYLGNQGYDVSGRGVKLNKVMIRFLKHKGLRYVRWNYRYKGLFTADLSNAVTIQEHWKEFKDWVQTDKLEHSCKK